MKKIILLFILFASTSSLWGQTITGDSIFQVGDSLIFNYTSATGDLTDWVGIYPANEVPDGDPPSLIWSYIKGKTGRAAFKITLPSGDYAAHLLCCDGYRIIATQKFKVKGAPPATIALELFAKADSNIVIKYSGGTGSPKDWIGIYKPTDKPGIDNSLLFEYVPSAAGTITFKKPALKAGNYVAKLFCCDGYNALASVDFTVYENLAPSVKFVAAPTLNKPFTVKFTGGTGDLTDWVGIYKVGDTPGGPNSQSYLYVNGVNGELTFAGDILKAGTAYKIHLFCCDGYNILATIDSFRVAASSSVTDLANQPKLFTVSPSPANEVVRLVFEEPIVGQFTFYNISGQAVRQQAVKGESQIEITGLPYGVYLGRLQSDKGIQTKKIMVMR